MTDEGEKVRSAAGKGRARAYKNGDAVRPVARRSLIAKRRNETKGEKVSRKKEGKKWSH